MTSVAAVEGRALSVADRLEGARVEWRVSAAVIGLAAVLFVLFVAVAPPVNPTFDDGKYIAVGRNVLDGNGPMTFFGVTFLKHSPLWPLIMAVPERLVGVPALEVGQWVNALSGAATIVLTGLVAWRVRPAIGAISAVIVGALPYTMDIARTAGIDLPSIALTLLYMLVGFRAVRTGSIGLGALAGLIAAASFLIKETILPFTMVPFLAGIMWGVPWARGLRVAAATIGVAVLGTAWWFWVYATYTERVYRADFPQWTMIPIAAAVALFVVVGLGAEPLAAGVRARGWDASLAARLPTRLRSRATLGWLATAAWFVVLCIFFGRTPKLLGASLFNPDQLAYFGAHINTSVRLSFAYGIAGILVVVELIRTRGHIAQAAIDLLIAVICGIPLVLLVAGVGETARHYIAELALLVALGTTGWALAIPRLRSRDWMTVVVVTLVILAMAVILAPWLDNLVPLRLRTIAVVVALAAGGAVLGWLVVRGRSTAAIVVVTVAVLVAGMGAVGVRASRLTGEGDRLEMQATDDVVAWIKANVDPGRDVGVGSYLAMNISIGLPSGTEIEQVRHFLAIADPKAPLGLRWAGGPLEDPIAIDAAPNKANQFDVFSASLIHDMMVDNQIEYYIYPVNRQSSSASILGSLTPENGFTEVATKTYEGGRTTIDVHYYKVDLDRVAKPTAIHVSTDALAVLVDRLERDPANGRVAAAGLAERIVPPADGSQDALIDRLRVLGGE